VLISENTDSFKAALALVGKTRPLLYAATAANLDALSDLSKELIVRSL
jgi:CO dehydrogenase/acetyl-CoA synthase gamma subunit (corrinoid Fe-S protein)